MGCVGGNTACATADGIGEDGLIFVGSVQLCRFGGRASVDGAWLTPSAAGSSPHKTLLETCATKHGGGVLTARNHNDRRNIFWSEAEQWTVNLSPKC